MSATALPSFVRNGRTEEMMPSSLMLAMTLIPLATALFACFLYLKKYKITEEKYLEILGELEENKANV